MRCSVMGQIVVLYLGNKLLSFIGREPIILCDTKTHVPWLRMCATHKAQREGDHEFCLPVYITLIAPTIGRFVRNSRGVEGTVKNSFLFEQLFICLSMPTLS